MNYPDAIIKVSNHHTISNYLVHVSNEDIVAEIFAGLSYPQKQISSRFFYNDTGSDLFEEITRLPEYYPTRTENSIILKVASRIMSHENFTQIVELGSGDCSKISILLDALPSEKLRGVRYIPVDVSRAAILKSSELLAIKHPGIEIHGILADFMKHFDLIPGEGKKLICFFGSTLGNLTGKQETSFLSNLKALMKPGDQLLIGMDMVKNKKILEDAYNDQQGITAAFNKNILNVVNHIAKTNFRPDEFEHYAFYNAFDSRIEMHLRALLDVEVSSPHLAGKIDIKKGETIHTENSHKYTPSYIQQMTESIGLRIKGIYTDANNWFSLVHTH